MRIKRVDWHGGTGFRVLGGFRMLLPRCIDLFGIRICITYKSENNWNSDPPFNGYSVSVGITIGRAYSGYLAQYGMLFRPGRRFVW